MGYDLYVVTDREVGGGRSHLDQARLAVAGGADVVQVRDKEMSTADLLRTAQAVRAVTASAGALLIVNDRLDVALAAGADGVHLGQDDLPVAAARALAPPGFVIGVSVGDVAEARAAVAGGADYLALSPIFSTWTKADAGPGHGLATLHEIRGAVSVPLLGIGGIGPENVAEVIAAGAEGVAVVSAVVGQEDVEGAARQMKTLIAAAKADLPAATGRLMPGQVEP
ncbi:thiamine-phosphate pyrophosphorylase [Methanofollis sp. W23]|uniref:thiamine phosphate synthase n=1 Tax=Methanofollis sp. W23 TaxID=2817849 RepID=UPI001AE68388|nr:thiamine phosphate synthase [Methanofollis sp. W23]MBP2146204.1 thiamine-phosphate pyrophosphorylase [Methanofollis sp. W23]